MSWWRDATPEQRKRWYYHPQECPHLTMWWYHPIWTEMAKTVHPDLVAWSPRLFVNTADATFLEERA